MSQFLGVPAILGGIGTIFGGLVGAQNAKAEAVANQIQTRWANFQNQWKINESNFQKAQQYGLQKASRLQAEEGTLKNQLAQERDLRRQLNQQHALLSRGFRQSAASLGAAAETRGLSTSRGTGALLQNALTENMWADLEAVRQNSSRQLTSIRENRKQQLASLGPLQIPMPDVFLESTMPMIPNTLGMVVGSAFKGIGQIAGGLGQREWFTNSQVTTSGAPS